MIDYEKALLGAILQGFKDIPALTRIVSGGDFYSPQHEWVWNAIVAVDATGGAVDSLAVETGALFVPALATLIVIASQGDLAFGRHGAGNTLLLLSTGVVTAVPLLLFAASTRRLPLSVLGLLQYLAPVLQFSVGVGIRHERLPMAELIGFAMVWAALIVLTVDGLRASRRRGGAPAESAGVLAG